MRAAEREVISDEEAEKEEEFLPKSAQVREPSDATHSYVSGPTLTLALATPEPDPGPDRP